MSLFRQLWLAIISLTVLAFVGSFLVSILTARSYLEQEILFKNADTAASLAISITQLPDKDPVTLGLLISAQFDTGHYQEIQLVDTQKKVMVERQYVGNDFSAPNWFVQLFPIRSEPGVAQIQDGWRNLGTLKVVSHSRFAYGELWRGALRQMAWFFAAGLVAGLLGTWLLRLIVRPLNQVVSQAHAISERQFVTLQEPRTPELRSVVKAMNSMVERLKKTFSDEAQRLDSLRRQVNHDALTGLPGRSLFINQLQSALDGDDAAPLGTLLMVRLSDLTAMNLRLGHTEANGLIKNVARVLEQACMPDGDRMVARLKGADFVLLAPNEAGAAELAAQISEALRNELVASYPLLADIFHIGAVRYRRHAPLSALLSAVDTNLAGAIGKGANTWLATEHDEPPLARSGEVWRSLLLEALTEKRLKLAFFPVVGADGVALHQESAIRLQPEHAGPWLVAGDFMPMAIRHKITSSLDLEVIQLALQTLQVSPGDLAVNLFAETIADWGFRNRLHDLLSRYPELSPRLWIEVSEYGVFRQIEAFRDLARTIKPLGCRIGVEHFGHRFEEIDQLADLGLDYLKIDSSFIRAIDQNPGNQNFLKGLCKMAHSIGVSVIAEGVQTNEELMALPHLGFDGVTGPAVSKKNSDL